MADHRPMRHEPPGRSQQPSDRYQPPPGRHQPPPPESYQPPGRYQPQPPEPYQPPGRYQPQPREPYQPPGRYQPQPPEPYQPPPERYQPPQPGRYQPPLPGRYPQAPQPQRRRGDPPRWPALIALAVVGLFVSGGGGALAYFAPALKAAVDATGQPASGLAAAGGAAAAAPVAPGAPFTVLFLGSDNDNKFDPQSLLTQSMILVRVDPVGKHVTMLSIPRDLYVPLSSGGGQNKIMAAFASGGPTSAIATVSRNFQVRIDDYVWIGLRGLVKLIDLLGGVDVTATNPVLDDFYPNDLENSDPYSYKRVAVVPGPQHLNGLQAMEYVRSRHSDLQGDIGRSKRQQAVLLALRAKAKYLTPSDIPDLAATFNGEFKTSIPLDRIRSLLPLASAMSDPSQVKQVFLDGSPYYTSGTAPIGDILRPNWSAILPLVHQDFPS